MSKPVNVGIIGLGRWAKVLTRAAKQSDRLTASELAIWHQIKAGQRS